MDAVSNYFISEFNPSWKHYSILRKLLSIFDSFVLKLLKKQVEPGSDDCSWSDRKRKREGHNEVYQSVTKIKTETDILNGRKAETKIEI